VGELISGSASNTHLQVWTRGREKEISAAFREQMNGTDVGKWLYNGVGTPEKPGDRVAQIVDLCNVELWRAGHDDARTVASSVTRLHRLSASFGDAGVSAFAQSCATLLDAVAATSSHRSDAPAAVARLDSLLRTGPRGFLQDAGNLILARLKEGRGDVRGALAAVRRRETFLTRPLYLSTFLREEGRLAALAGENDAAIEAYRHYLTLRAAPEPPLRSEVEYVRDELGKLERAGMTKE